METANASPQTRLAKASRGQTLLTVLVFVLVTSLILAGIGSLVVSDYRASGLGVDYDRSLFAAEAGINYELNKISLNAANVDQKQSGSTPGTTYITAAGTFSVYVTQRNLDGTEASPWSVGNNLWVYATGQSGSVNRTIRVAATGYGTAVTGGYGTFGMTEGIIKGTPTVVDGDVGTNGWLNFTGNPTITGSVIFNGAGSNWQSKPGKGYTTVYNPSALAWPTVEAIAVSAFGATGLSYVASHNDNLLANPPISSPGLSLNSGTQTFVGKPGGANYYLTSLYCGGNSLIYFDNRNGPITIWAGPSGSSSTFSFTGGSAAVKMSTDPTKPCRVYIALINDVNWGGNVEMDAGLYNVNAYGSGRVNINGSPVVYGSVISNKFTFNGNPDIVYTPGYFSINSQIYYGVVTPYSEVGGFY